MSFHPLKWQLFYCMIFFREYKISVIFSESKTQKIVKNNWFKILIKVMMDPTIYIIDSCYLWNLYLQLHLLRKNLFVNLKSVPRALLESFTDICIAAKKIELHDVPITIWGQARQPSASCSSTHYYKQVSFLWCI